MLFPYAYAIILNGKAKRVIASGGINRNDQHFLVMVSIL